MKNKLQQMLSAIAEKLNVLKLFKSIGNSTKHNVGNNFKTNEKLKYSEKLKWKPKLWWLTYPLDLLMLNIADWYCRRLIYYDNINRPIDKYEEHTIGSLRLNGNDRMRFAIEWDRILKGSLKSSVIAKRYDISIYYFLNRCLYNAKELCCDYNKKYQISFIYWVLTNYCKHRRIINESIFL